MLGWHVSVFRQKDGGLSPATADAEEGVRLAVWQTGSDGLQWLDELVEMGQMIDLGGDGYPRRYSAQAKHLTSRIVGGPPLALDNWVRQPGDILTSEWEGKTVIDRAAADDCRPDEWLLIIPALTSVLLYLRSLRKARIPLSRETQPSKVTPPTRTRVPIPEPPVQPAAKPLSSTVKALVVRSPWAQEIASGEKKIEYRCWRTKYRGWLAIVAARRKENRDDAGRVVCIVRITDCVEVDDGKFEWNLSNPIPLTQRVEISGRLGLFDVTDKLPAAVLALAT